MNLMEDVGLGAMAYNGHEQTVRWDADNTNSTRTDNNMGVAQDAIQSLIGDVSGANVQARLKAILAELEKVYFELQKNPKVEGSNPVDVDDLERIVLLSIKSLEELQK